MKLKQFTAKAMLVGGVGLTAVGLGMGTAIADPPSPPPVPAPPSAPAAPGAPAAPATGPGMGGMPGMHNMPGMSH